MVSHIGKGAEGYLTTLLMSETIPRAHYVNETLVQNIVGCWWSDRREKRCTIEEHLSRCRLPNANTTQSGLGLNPVVFAVNQSGTWTYFSPSNAAFPFQNRSSNAAC